MVVLGKHEVPEYSCFMLKYTLELELFTKVLGLVFQYLLAGLLVHVSCVNDLSIVQIIQLFLDHVFVVFVGNPMVFFHHFAAVEVNNP